MLFVNIATLFLFIFQLCKSWISTSSLPVPVIGTHTDKKSPISTLLVQNNSILSWSKDKPMAIYMCQELFFHVINNLIMTLSWSILYAFIISCPLIHLNFHWAILTQRYALILIVPLQLFCRIEVCYPAGSWTSIKVLSLLQLLTGFLPLLPFS